MSYLRSKGMVNVLVKIRQFILLSYILFLHYLGSYLMRPDLQSEISEELFVI